MALGDLTFNGEALEIIIVGAKMTGRTAATRLSVAYTAGAICRAHVDETAKPAGLSATHV